VLRASFRLAPCLRSPPRDLATSRRARRAMRPIDFCHPCELRAPAPRAFPARWRPFRDVDAPQSLGSVRHDRGTECFTPPGTLRRIELRHVCFVSRPFRYRRGSRAWASSSHGAGSIEPLTSLSPLPLLARLTRLRVCSARDPAPLVEARRGCRADRIDEEAAKAAVTTAP